ncbi:hypothetical protein [Thermococcus thermotolerans]|uniref:hypothetical protein n=1 Tax=Thermococcus thermotolerans TaxID=2969672 RepID=UPI0021572C8B|nr:hypothetical protein [Thermococcus thermotolerans]
MIEIKLLITVVGMVLLITALLMVLSGRDNAEKNWKLWFINSVFLYLLIGTMILLRESKGYENSSLEDIAVVWLLITGILGVWTTLKGGV